jgi:hypothetical protein
MTDPLAPRTLPVVQQVVAETVGVLGVPRPSKHLKTRVLWIVEVDPWLLSAVEKMRFSHNHH